MSKYTTEVRYICEVANGLNESVDRTSVNEVIANALPSVFDFDFPIFDENYRNVLETKILKHYYTREIGLETVGLWKLKLETKLNEIMPYYNKLYLSELLEFNPFYSTNITKTGSNSGSTSNSENENIDDETNDDKNTSITGRKENNNTSRTVNDGTSSSTSNTTSESESSESRTNSGTENRTTYNLFSDTPQGALTNVDNETYLSSATKVTDSGTTSEVGSASRTDESSNSGTTSGTVSSTTNVVGSDTGTKSESIATDDTRTYARERTTTGNGTTTGQYLETIVGYQGFNASEMLLKYRQTFMNIDMMVIRELEELFMQLW